MEQPTLRINDNLQIKIKDDPNALPCYSRVEDVSEGCIVVAWPLDCGVQLPFRIDQPLSMSFVREGVAYVFTGVVQKKQQSPIPHLSIRPLGRPERVQRRDYFRVKVAVDVELGGVVDFPSDRGTTLYIKTNTYDLSGGGLSFRSESLLPVGNMLEARLALSDKEPKLILAARVVYVIPIAGPDGRALYHIGVSFSGIKEAERGRILRYLYHVQRTQIT